MQNLLKLSYGKKVVGEMMRFLYRTSRRACSSHYVALFRDRLRWPLAAPRCPPGPRRAAHCACVTVLSYRSIAWLSCRPSPVPRAPDALHVHDVLGSAVHNFISSFSTAVVPSDGHFTYSGTSLHPGQQSENSFLREVQRNYRADNFISVILAVFIRVLLNGVTSNQ